MSIQRADVLYPVNSTTVDTAAGIDIRLLAAAEAGATDSDQSCRWTNANDSVERTFDPDTALATAVANATSFQGEGWALRLVEDHTPADDTNCNSVLKAGTLTVQVRCLLNMTGGTGQLGGAENFTMRASLWRYDTSANTGVSIASGSTAQSWDTSSLGDENNTRKDTAISIVVASDVEFLANEVLLLQLGALSGTLTNPLTGTTNFDMTLDVDDPGTFLDFATDQGIRQTCVLSLSAVGSGVVPPAVRAATTAKSLVGAGTAASTKLTDAAKTFSLVGRGTTTHVKAAAKPFALVGRGTPALSRVVAAAKSFSVDGRGTVSRVLAGALPRTAQGRGTVTSSKATVAAKAFSLVGKGTATESRAVAAFRTFSLVGKAAVTHTKAVAEDFDVAGRGAASFSRAVVAAKSFTLVGKATLTRVLALVLSRSVTGKGVVTEVHPVQAYRTFSLVGKGEIPTAGPNASTITIPIDEVPEGGGGTTIVKKAIFVFDD